MGYPLDKYVKKPLTCGIFQKQRHIMNHVIRTFHTQLIGYTQPKNYFFSLFKIMSVNELPFSLTSSLLSR